MRRIDTAEDFERARAELEPIYITSRTHGRVLVPCVNTMLVRVDLIVANGWNPNTVSPDKMDLLRQSILDNGFCFPVVAIWDAETGRFVIIDGFHRTTIGGSDWLDFDYIPLVVLQHDIASRMAATMQFNRARGVHQVDLDADVVRALVEQGVTDEDIATRLGMELDAVHRYKQITGVAELFKNSEYSLAWEMVDDD
jgi:ParB-like chromosome segregation protein Spo0J